MIDEILSYNLNMERQTLLSHGKLFLSWQTLLFSHTHKV